MAESTDRQQRDGQWTDERRTTSKHTAYTTDSSMADATYTQKQGGLLI